MELNKSITILNSAPYSQQSNQNFNSVMPRDGKTGTIVRADIENINGANLDLIQGLRLVVTLKMLHPLLIKAVLQ